MSNIDWADGNVRQCLMGLKDRLGRALERMAASDKVPLLIIGDGDARLIVNMCDECLVSRGLGKAGGRTAT